jgi:hypothetical protein
LGGKFTLKTPPASCFCTSGRPDGRYVAQGSGFLVDSSKLVTNAHVANSGKVFIELGAARLPTNVEKIDSLNDLAILSVDVEMTVKPLVLASVKPSPGDLIFAITNPEGLERTISQGVISANRQFSNRKLLQISTPISHGSSGGPIFNRDGQVVGIAVGTLEDGQNLNFAVPSELLTQPMSRGSPKPSDLDSVIDQITTVQAQQAQEKYSADPDSDFQKKQGELEALLNKGAHAAENNADALLKVAKIAEPISTDIAIAAAQRATEVRPAPDSYLLLANVLYDKYTWLQGDERNNFMKQAEGAARSAIKAAKSPTAEMLFRLGDTLDDEVSTLIRGFPSQRSEYRQDEFCLSLILSSRSRHVAVRGWPKSPRGTESLVRRVGKEWPSERIRSGLARKATRRGRRIQGRLRHLFTRSRRTKKD